MGFAFVDVETTGLIPERTDRVVEIAVIVTDDHLREIDRYESLVNPGRDVGPTTIHGISASQVLAAPRFEQLAPGLVGMLHGRVIVAHNVRFDERFLTAELTRSGVNHHLGQGACTLAIARRNGWRMKLDELVDQLAITRQGHSHSALSDALACLEVARRAPGMVAGTPFGATHDPADRSRLRGLRRTVVDLSIEKRRYFATIPETSSYEASSYLDLVGRCLADGVLDAAEHATLRNLIQHYRFTRDEVLDLHQRYVHRVIEIAANDGHIDHAEWGTIQRAAYYLGVDLDVTRVMATLSLAEQATASAGGLEAGQVVCFTGDYHVDRAVLTEQAEAAGLLVSKNVTKKVDVLICSDVHSASGKAAKARQHGIPVTDYSTLEHYLDSVSQPN